MPVVSTDLVLYAAENMPLDDATTAGGTVNQTMRVTFDDLLANDVVQAASDSVSDSGTLTITGRNAGGQIVTDTIAMQGTTVVTGTVTFERILIVQNDELTTGVVTVEDTTPTQIGQIAASESGFRRPFYNATANEAGGSDKELYEKICLRNNNSTNALLDAFVIEVQSGNYTGLIDFGLEDSFNSNQSIGNRTLTPTGVDGGYSANPPSASGVPGAGDLVAGDFLGIWLRFDLDAGQAADNDYYQLQVSGSTT